MKSLNMFDDSTVLIIDDQTTSRTILSQVVKSIHPKMHVVEKPTRNAHWNGPHKTQRISPTAHREAETAKAHRG